MTEFSEQEEKITKKKAQQLFDKHLLDTIPVGTFAGLQMIHKYLFEDIYDFAGEIRFLNISKGNFRFAPVMYLETSIQNIEKMPEDTFDESHQTTSSAGGLNFGRPLG